MSDWQNKHMWMAVLWLAVIDSTGHGKSSGNHCPAQTLMLEAKQWLWSEDCEYVCELLDVEHSNLLRICDSVKGLKVSYNHATLQNFARSLHTEEQFYYEDCLRLG